MKEVANSNSLSTILLSYYIQISTNILKKEGEKLSLSINVHFQQRQQVVKNFELPKCKWEASGKLFWKRQQVVKFGMALIWTSAEMTTKS